MIEGIDHIAITVRDLNESLEFYTKLLGLTVVRKMETPDMNIVFLQAGETKIELFGLKKEKTNAPIPIGTKDLGLKHIAFKVDNVEALAKDLKDKGINFIRGPEKTVAGLTIAFFKDPNDVSIELIQWK